MGTSTTKRQTNLVLHSCMHVLVIMKYIFFCVGKSTSKSLHSDVHEGNDECPSFNQTPGRQIDNLYPLYLCIFTKPGAGEIAARFLIFRNKRDVPRGPDRAPISIRYSITKFDIFHFRPVLLQDHRNSEVTRDESLCFQSEMEGLCVLVPCDESVIHVYAKNSK